MGKAWRSPFSRARTQARAQRTVECKGHFRMARSQTGHPEGAEGRPQAPRRSCTAWGPESSCLGNRRAPVSG